MESTIAQGVCIKCKHAFTHAATMLICDHHTYALPREICQRICDHFAFVCYRWCKASHRNRCLSDFFWSYLPPSLTRRYTERIYKHSASPITKPMIRKVLMLNIVGFVEFLILVLCGRCCIDQAERILQYRFEAKFKH
jgi:hypothetical protein